MKKIYQIIKKNHNSLFVISLAFSAVAVSGAMMAVFLPRSTFSLENSSIFLVLSLVLSLVTLFSYIFMVFSRVKPTKTIFISFSNKDRLYAERVKEELSENFKSLSKYKYKIYTDEDIPYGVEINKYKLSLIDKTSIFLVIVSTSYTESENCRKELNYIMNKQANNNDVSIIPIVLDRYGDLSELGYNLNNIKSLSLIDCKDSEVEMKKQINILATDLIKHIN